MSLKAAIALALIFACHTFASGCQDARTLPVRAAPSEQGPFAGYGYRNMSPDPIPATEIPHQNLTSFINCVRGHEERIAATWVRDWFAAISMTDRCDQWAIQRLSHPELRKRLVALLVKTQSKVDGDQCKDRSFALLTSIDETNGLLAEWGRHGVVSCDVKRTREVRDKRREEFTKSLAGLSDALRNFQGG